ncbi:MAG: amino acid adenylation domain-containing protein, partial [bacterium]|nr:amino acid adenylation domain-containing protein [bacterium]
VTLAYRDFSQWQTHRKGSEALKRQETFWLDVFKGEPTVLDLPADRPRPSLQQFQGDTIYFDIGADETAQLNRLAKAEGASLYILLLAIYNVLLFKVTGQEDFSVGTPVMGRRNPVLHQMMGMMGNTLALRNFPRKDLTFMEFLRDLKTRTLDAFENQDYQFEELVKLVALDRDAGRNPVFDTMFVLQNVQLEEIQIPGLKLKRYRYESNTSIFDFSIHGWEIGDGLTFMAEYSTALFNRETIQTLIGYFNRVLTAALEEPSKPLSHFDIVDENERKEIMELSNGMKEELDPRETIHLHFEEQAARTPDSVALVYTPGKGKRETLTFIELNKRANQLAHGLRAKGVRPNTIVGLLMTRSLEMITGMLAIIKAGGAYLPIDPRYPANRKTYMLEDSEVNTLLVNDDVHRFTGSVPNNLHIIDVRDNTLYNQSGKNLKPLNRCSDLLYLIYTSGSTGKPKGVMLEHYTLMNLIWFQFRHTIIDFSRVLQFVTISFDVSLQEICSTLLYGGELSVVSEKILEDIPRLFNLIRDRDLKTLFLPASFLKFIINETHYRELLPDNIDHIVTAGEQVIVTDAFRDYLKENNIFLHNHYGPSETHVVTTLTLDPKQDIPELPPIGKPVMNTNIYILDSGRRLRPIGLAGELYIGGVQVGRGYLKQPQLTADKFDHDIKEKEKLYRTGDLARWLEDGNIQFLGRIDHQVKIRGFRIEPGEIETHLLNHDTIKEAVVIPQIPRKNKGDRYLCAYIVPLSGEVTGLNASGLREFLSRDLPDYMVPSYFMFLEKIPLTPNGKVDRQALPPPGASAEEQYTAPATPLEKQLVEIWSGLLDIEKESIGIDGNFFQLGGHSLNAFLMISRVHKALNVDIPLAAIFKNPSVRLLSGYITHARKEIHTPVTLVEEKEYYVLSSAQKRLYVLQQLDEDGISYNMTSISHVEGNLDADKLTETFKRMVERHESLRTAFQSIDGETVQRVYPTGAVIFEIPYHSRPIETAKPVIKDFIRAFDLSRPPLIRVGLIRLGEKEHILMVDIHHIISDGMSLGIFVKEFMALYAGEQCVPLQFRYKDYSQWQHRRKHHDEMNRQREYWLDEFNDLEEIPLLNLPIDGRRPAVLSFQGDRLNFELPASQLQRLKTVALEQGVTLFMVLFSLYTIFLSKISGQEAILVGTPAAGRHHADLEHLIGMFVNTLVIKNKPHGDKHCGTYLNEVREKTLEAFANQDYQYEELVEQVVVNRDPGHNPLF